MTTRYLIEAPNLKAKKVLVMGLGLFGGGVGLVRYLVKKGAKVTVTDLRPFKDLVPSIRKLKGLPVTYHLNGHQEDDFKKSDLIFVNPAVNPESPFLKIARDHKIPLETELNLFFKLCKSPKIVGVTGSNGKTTTTMLIYKLFEKIFTGVWLGGNIGGSILEKVDQIGPGDVIVLELSSFQLEALDSIKISPQISCVLNITPNHLDRHRSMKDYIDAKKVITKYQDEHSACVLNYDDSMVRKISNGCSAATMFFSMTDILDYGVFASLAKNSILFSDSKRVFSIDIRNRKLPGDFNLQNMLCAAAVCYSIFGNKVVVLKAILEKVLNSFKGLSHRLELVREIKGVRYYNDSKATDPESTIAAVNAIKGPHVLILGGFDKKLSFVKLARELARKDVRFVVLIGQTKERLYNLLCNYLDRSILQKVSTLEEAVKIAKAHAENGDSALFSPACASYDMFRNFEERGRLFTRIVKVL